MNNNEQTKTKLNMNMYQNAGQQVDLDASVAIIEMLIEEFVISDAENSVNPISASSAQTRKDDDKADIKVKVKSEVVISHAAMSEIENVISNWYDGAFYHD